jgi:hypothetical protein
MDASAPLRFIITLNELLRVFTCVVRGCVVCAKWWLNRTYPRVISEERKRPPIVLTSLRARRASLALKIRIVTASVPGYRSRPHLRRAEVSSSMCRVHHESALWMLLSTSTGLTWAGDRVQIPSYPTRWGYVVALASSFFRVRLPLGRVSTSYVAETVAYWINYTILDWVCQLSSWIDLTNQPLD